MNCRYVFEVNEVSKNSWNHNSQKLDEYFLFRRNRKKGPKQSLFFVCYDNVGFCCLFSFFSVPHALRQKFSNHFDAAAS